MSWVFLTDTKAWKLKKPVRYDFLDFSTLEARRRDCEEELRLNRRLAADVYYGAVPLTVDSRGEMRLAGDEETIDWLVKMRRLPADLMLDRAIANRTVSAEDAQKVSALLARFYMRSLPVEMTASEYRERLTDDIRANQRELENPDYALPAELLESITRAQLEFLERERELLDRRVQDGKIIEAHGDLRPEHICLEREPVIIDCLEFNRDFRILDTASELAFLALECERLGAPQVGDLILETYSDETGDRPPVQLLAFYKSYHACLRAKIAVWHLKDHVINDAAKWTGRATHYLHLAARGASISRATPQIGTGGRISSGLRLEEFDD
jgi:aminoglycoside phosphotransferase family enzyme